MKRPTFFEGVAVAFVASAFGSISYVALSAVYPGVWILHGLTAVLGLGYVVYLLIRSAERVGRVTALVLWTIVVAGTLSIDPPLALHVLVQLGFVWLIRSLYYHASVLCALADLGLSALSLAAGFWALSESGACS